MESQKRYTKKQRTLDIIERLKKEYPDTVCTLDTSHAWQLLVSVRLAAQCTDARVNVVVQDLFAKYPGVKELAAAAVPDNTGYITEGQLFLRNDSDTGRVIVDPFRSLSRLKQLVIGKKTREDHPQVMNACVRLYADAANAKTKLENGFDLSDYDERALKFAHDYSEKLLSIDINIDIDQMLDTAWKLFAEYFTKTEVAIKEELIQKYWKE